MTTKEFYENLENSVWELTIDYAQKLRGIGEDLLVEISTSVFNEEELEIFISEQEKKFHEQMKSVIDDIRKKIEDSANVNQELQEKTFSRIGRSFGRIFEKMVSSLRDLLK